ncbi:hypothetical protein EMIHUDRAFT_238915 [Emiliania huxleyi CCMP1516]|uniref:Hcy-binding domain-containing protein n=2 Tax=Emiliania huxleyi TaxID=2903 RepID=A0A0D3JKY9_EMIH1|nr:hypothetical protein EMIHUDRAFT_238915 [Emiliania huxleyi CCMP1516]EOD24174.1 hypothetical protein EMIHUDRAFT_238915 [Emiliania huxleyi CCMP1516]|eukprot:XP_005776603.1 hypothetical protein EMIHUDRAFT_238915 [Emiliania huxleyi CCMP1516]
MPSVMDDQAAARAVFRVLYDQQRRLEAALRGAGVAVEPPFVGEAMPHVFPLFATAAWGPGLHTGDASPPHPAVESVEAAAAGASPVLDRIASIFPESERPLVLDGGLGTWLELLGRDALATLPDIVTYAPDALRSAHADFVAAGADALVALLDIDEDAAARLVARSVTLARDGTRAALRRLSQGSGGICGGGGGGGGRLPQGPYGASVEGESEYSGRLGAPALAAWHAWRAGADVLAFETVPCVTEVVALCTLLQSRPAARAWLSLACRSAAARAAGWVAVGPDGAPSAESAAAGAERFGRLARQWAADGAVLIGGCCRTRPDHIAAAQEALASIVFDIVLTARLDFYLLIKAD